MRLFSPALLLGLLCTALHAKTSTNRNLSAAYNSYPNSFVPARQLGLTGNVPDNIQLQNLYQSYNQMQAMNPKADADAEADGPDMMLAAAPKSNRSLKTRLVNQNDSLRYLNDDPKEGAGEEMKEAEGEPKTEESSAPVADAGAVGDAGAGEGNPGESVDGVDAIIDRLIKRVDSLDDKIDHLLFHNHHDLAGLTAYYTPYGIQMLPSKKPKDSVDQKLKMIDYMHNLGGGYNPMLHQMLPYYLGQEGGDQQQGIKVNGIPGLAEGGARKKKLL